MDPALVDRHVVEQRLAGLLLVALRVVGGHEALVAPEELDPRPVHRLPCGTVPHLLQHGDAGTPAGEHERRPAAPGLRIGQRRDQPGGAGGGQHVRIGVDDDVGGGPVAGARTGKPSVGGHVPPSLPVVVGRQRRFVARPPEGSAAEVPDSPAPVPPAPVAPFSRRLRPGESLPRPRSAAS